MSNERAAGLPPRRNNTEQLARLWNGQEGQRQQWGIFQKQTGADKFSLGATLASNAHGVGLGFKPIVDQVESFTVVGAEVAVRRYGSNDY